MTYEALKQEMGKQFVVIVELYIDKCSLVYGVAPCTAAVPTTGTQKCFNTLKTCQDTTHYDPGVGGTKVYRFSTTYIPELQAAGDAVTFPTIRSVQTAPTRLVPGKGFGIRSSVVIGLEDHPWTDVSVDPYLRTRSYVPDNQGSFWGKFLARNPNYEGRRIDVLTGYLADDGTYNVANFQRRTYLINKISGPDTDGRVQIEAKDPLKKTDINKAQWPVASRASLSTIALVGDTDLFIADPDGDVAAAFALGQTYLRIEDEIVNVVSVTDDTGGFYTVVVLRTDSPSIYDNSLNVQAEHAVNSGVQPCWFFDQQRIDEVLYTLLFDASSIPASYLPTATWATEVDEGGLNNYILTALIVEPTGVQTLLDELSQHGIYMWWDERQQVVLMKSVITQSFDDTPFNEDSNIIAGSLSVTRDVNSRISQAWMYYSLRFPTLDMKLLPSYRTLQIKIDTSAESPQEYDQSRAQIVFSRWLPIAKSSIAAEISTRLLRSYRDSKIILAMSLDPKDDSAWTGDLIGVTTSLVQDESGAPVQTNYSVIEVDEAITDAGVLYKYILQSERTVLRAGLISPTTEPADNLVWDDNIDIVWDGDEIIDWEYAAPVAFPDYTPASDAQKRRYAFISPDSGFFSDGTPAYEIR